MNLPEGYALRPRTDRDLAFLRDLYAHTREEEMRLAPWPEQRKREFLDDQFAKQHAHYLQHYPRARWQVVTFDGEPVGRLYAERTPAEVRIMDVALLAPHRNRGVGTAMMRSLLAEADSARLRASLHVEPFNPALRLYRRLGFEQVETHGIYWYMERPASVEDDFVLGAVCSSGDRHDEHVEPAVRRVQ
jgi:ribosomal protein S18 acetylase RimI-like enzyme